MNRNRSSNRLLIFSLLMFGGVLLYALGSSGVLRPLVNLLMAPIVPAVSALNGGAETVAGSGSYSQDAAALNDRVRQLERALAELQVEIVRLREIEQDYYRLAGLAEYAAQNPEQSVVSADVIARDTSSYLRWIIINRGARDGIQVGDPVINDRGLVGRVEDVSANAAWVRLLIDPASIVNARLQTARAEGTLTGQLQGNLNLGFIPQESQIEVGDLVLTSGLGGRYPPNIVIGQVVSVVRQPAALFQEAEVRPTVDFAQLDIVGVITSVQAIDPSIFDDNLNPGGTP
jgi:rod shape-determining protein MreC